MLKRIGMIILIRTQVKNKLEKSILNLISGACFYKYVVSYRLPDPEGCAASIEIYNISMAA